MTVAASPDGEPPKKRRKGATPLAVEQAIVKDLAAMPKGQRNGLVDIAGKWGVTVSIVEEISKRQKMDLMTLRQKVAENGFMLAARIDERLVEKLEDDDAMADTPFHHLAASREKVIDSSVTAAEGHQQIGPVFNIAFVKEARQTLAHNDEMLRMKRAKAITTG